MAIKYLGSVRVTAGVEYTSTAIIASFTGANVVKAKIDHVNDTKAFVNNFVRVSINSTPLFHLYDGDECAIASGQTFVFNVDFTLAVGVV